MIIALTMALGLAQNAEDVRRTIGDTALVGPWIYEDVEAGFAEAKKSGKPLAVFLRCVP